MRCFTSACALWLLQAATIGLATPFTSRSDEGGSFQNGVYFINWGMHADFAPSNLAANNINHVFYAFLNVAPDGTVSSSNATADLEMPFDGDDPTEDGTNAYGAVKQLALLKAQNRHVKTLLSIGGNGVRSKNFTKATSTEENRARFATTSLNLLKNWGFDGIDVDWEYPKTDGDAKNYLLLFDALRAELDAYSKKSADDYHFLITATTSVANSYTSLVDLKALGEKLDWINLMGYDYSGDWTKTAAHQANLFTSTKNGTTYAATADAVDRYVDGGAPAEKLLLGMPLYSRQFMGEVGLGARYNGGNGKGSNGPGSWLYKDLPREGAEEKYDGDAGASYSWDPQGSGIMNSYDTLEAVGDKVKFLKDKGMGGAFFWEASGDKEGEGSLMGATAKGFGGLDMSENQVDYPESTYDNIKAGYASDSSSSRPTPFSGRRVLQLLTGAVILHLLV